MQTTVKFTGCDQLDYRDDYGYDCLKQLLGTGQVFWLRNVQSGLPAMVQFCNLRGRLNSPTACISKDNARCHLYNEVEHEVTLDPDLDLKGL